MGGRDEGKIALIFEGIANVVTILPIFPESSNVEK